MMEMPMCRLKLWFKHWALAVMTFTFCVGHISSMQASKSDILICSDICISQANYIDFKECLTACRNLLLHWPEGDLVEEDIPQILQSNYGQEDTDDVSDLTKRQKSAFVRIGKQRSHFLRIGRSIDDHFEGNEGDDREGLQEDKRMSSFVRIGKALQEAGGQDVNRRASSFVRIGKSEPNSYVYKRPSSFVRIGKKSSDMDEESMSDSMDEGYNSYGDLFEEPKRMSSFVRIGKKDDIDEEAGDHDLAKRLSSFVRIGRNPEDIYDDASKRATSSFVRIGRGGKKRYSSFVRIGKREQYGDDEMPEEVSKRLSSFVRIGKSLGPDDHESVAAANSVDKKASSFVRIGKSINDEEVPFSSEASKRASSFVRIGKSMEDDGPRDMDQQKRMSSFVRIGKSWDASAGDPQETKRLSSFVRIGKRNTPEE